MPCLFSKIKLVHPGNVSEDNQSAHWSCCFLFWQSIKLYFTKERAWRFQKYVCHGGYASRVTFHQAKILPLTGQLTVLRWLIKSIWSLNPTGNSRNSFDSTSVLNTLSTESSKWLISLFLSFTERGTSDYKSIQKTV